MAWPQGEKNRAGLVEENRWPLPDSSIDRLLIVHGLEEASDPRRLMREAWRVLAPEGRLIIVAAHRRGLWSVIDTTPFAAGRPYLRRQLDDLLQAAMFRALSWQGALYFPPFGARFLLRAASAWERAGAKLWPGLGGVLMVEAVKELLAPVGKVQRARVRTLRPSVARPAAAVRDGNVRTSS
jgi:SAM-dependent methyltransferase